MHTQFAALLKIIVLTFWYAHIDNKHLTLFNTPRGPLGISELMHTNNIEPLSTYGNSTTRYICVCTCVTKPSAHR